MILFGCSDSGPAKYLATIINMINIPYKCISTGLSNKIFNFYNIKTVSKFEEIDFLKIKLIVTGTSLDKGIDKKCVVYGRERSIPTCSIIEHWSLYKERFKLKEKYVYPDYILVNDQYAKDEAIQAGIPKDKIKYFGNPYLEYLSKQNLQPTDKKIWRKKIGLNNIKVITFISEIYRDDFPKHSLLYPGFDEFEVLETILELATELNYGVLIKKHPSEDKKKYDKFVSKNVKLSNWNDFDSLVMNSDFIVGMGSMFLIETALFRSDIISFRPNERIEFIGNKLKITKKITDKTTLNQVFIGNITIQNDKYRLLNNSCRQISGFFESILN